MREMGTRTRWREKKRKLNPVIRIRTGTVKPRSRSERNTGRRREGVRR